MPVLRRVIRPVADRPTPIVRGLARSFALLSLASFAACAGGADSPTEPLATSILEEQPRQNVELTGMPLPFGGEQVLQRGVTRIAIPTYDGSGEAVHPDVVAFPGTWNGYRYWSAFTPYKNSTISLENPSLLGSQDGRTWDSPIAGINPLTRASRGHLSDPDMIFERKSGQLWMYYREVELAGGKANGAHVADHVWMMRSADGHSWQSPVELFSDKGKYVVSPSIVEHPSDGFHLFSVDAGTGGCSAASTKIVQRHSEDGVTWSEAQAVSLTQPGYQPWHLDVQYLADRSEYWALIAAYPSGKGCHSSSLFLATSHDGQAWTTYPRPVLSPREYPAFATTVYRSTFSVETDSLTIWYSGARQTRRGKGRRPAVLQWSMASARSSVEALMTRVQDKSGAAKLSLAPLTDAQTVGITPP